MTGRDARESAPGRHRFKRGRLHWSLMPSGGFHPFGLRAARAEVLLLTGRWVELEQLYRQDLDRARAAGLRAVQARLLMHHGELLGWRGHNKRAGVLLEEAAVLFRELGDEQGLLQCRNGLAVTCIALREYDRAEALVNEAERSARLKGYREILCWLLNSHAVLCRERGQLDRAIAYLEERMAISRELGGLTDVASSHLNIAVIFSEMGRHDLALEQNQAALELSLKIGDRAIQHYVLFNQAQILRHLGRLEECLEYLRRALVVSKNLGDGDTATLVREEIAKISGGTSK